jgi:tRNA 2-thiouridine synthesizing protein A
MSEHSVDARRLLCPMPVIRTQNKAEELAKGDVLKVVCTDPGVTNDIPAWCRINGHQVLDIVTQGNEITITIEVGGLE